MWTTADGFVLRIPSFRMRKWAQELKRHGLLGKNCKGPCECRLKRGACTCGCLTCTQRSIEELESELFEMARGARRVGKARGRKSGRSMSIFSTKRGPRKIRLFTRPLFGNQHALLGLTQSGGGGDSTASEPAQTVVVEPAPAEPAAAEPAEEPADQGSAPEEPPPAGDGAMEFEVVRGPLSARIEWSEPMTLEAAKSRSKWPAVYIIEVNGEPEYVGQTFDIPERMTTHLRDYAAGQSAAGRWKKGKLTVRVGRIFPKPHNVLETVEHSVVRALMNGGRTLANESPKATFTTGGNLVIKGILPAGANYTKIAGVAATRISSNQLSLTKGASYELFSDLELFE